MMHVSARRDGSRAASYLPLTCVILSLFFSFCFGRFVLASAGEGALLLAN